jgi:secreted protein with Ig-like and vWFA domain
MLSNQFSINTRTVNSGPVNVGSRNSTQSLTATATVGTATVVNQVGKVLDTSSTSTVSYVKTVGKLMNALVTSNIVISTYEMLLQTIKYLVKKVVRSIHPEAARRNNTVTISNNPRNTTR